MHVIFSGRSVFPTTNLKGPAAILISRDTCSYSITKLFRACFCVGGGGYRTILVRCVAKEGIAQMCPCEAKHQGAVSHHFGEVLTSLKVSRDMGYHSDSIAVSRYRDIMGPLSN